MPDLISIILLAIILLISLKVLDYARRVIMFWVLLAFRLVFWGTVLGLAWYVYRVGVENAGRDLGWAWGVVVGFVEDWQRSAAAAAAAAATAGAGANANVGGSGREGWGAAGRKGYSRGW